MLIPPYEPMLISLSIPTSADASIDTLILTNDQYKYPYQYFYFTFTLSVIMINLKLFYYNVID